MLRSYDQLCPAFVPPPNTDDATAPPSPFTLPVGCACLERLCLERFCPQVRVARAATAPGLGAAREVALEDGLGWRLVKVRAAVCLCTGT